MPTTSRPRGQGLIEYLILVCLIAVSAVAIVSVVGQNLKARFATISATLRGDKTIKKELEAPESSLYELRGFEDYTETAGKGRGRGW